MAIAHRRSNFNTNDASSSSVTVTLPSVNAGDLIVVGFGGADAGTAPTINTPTDSSGNTYFPVAATNRNATQQYSVRMFYAYNVASSGTLTITCTSSGALTFWRQCVSEYFDSNGAWATDPFDQVSSATGNSTSVACGSMTPTKRGEVFVVVGAEAAGGIASVTGGTLRCGSGSSAGMGDIIKFGSDQAAVNPTIVATTGQFTAQGATFKQALPDAPGQFNAKFICGAECGISVTGATPVSGTRHWSAASTSPNLTVVTSGPSPMRSTRCFRMNTTAATAQATHTFATAIASPATLVWRFAIYFTTLPSATVDISIDANTALGIYFHQPSGTFRGGSSTSLIAGSGSTVTTGVWYVVDVRVVINTTRTVDFMLNGVAGPGYSVSSSASTSVAVRFGHIAAVATADYYIDDILVSGTAADYPIGDGVVYGVYPNGDRTAAAVNPDDSAHGHLWANTNTAFAKGTSGATATGAQNVESTSWQSLQNPLSTTIGSTWVTDLAGASTEMLAWVFQALPGTGIDGVNGLMVAFTAHAASTTTSAHVITFGNTVNGGLSTPFSGSISVATIAVLVFMQNTPVEVVQPGWTAALVGHTVLKFNSGDVNPDPYVDGIMMEVDTWAAPVVPAALQHIDSYRQLMNH